MSRKFKHDGGSKASRKKSLVLMASILLILAISVGGTLAYLATNTGNVKNTFTPATPDTEITETLTGAVKSNVAVKNTGEVDMYIRARYFVVWRHNDSIVTQPDNVSITITQPNGTQWVEGADGYWYYPYPVAPGSSTSELIDEAKVTGLQEGDGYKVDLEILSQAIQAEPAQAVKDAWSSGVSGVNPDGRLSIK